MLYATKDDYLKYYTVLPEDFDMLCRRASQIIDNLTYNRIVAVGFDSLTAYQKSVIIECCCEIIQFYDDNVDILDSVLSAYNINGVSMQWSTNKSVCVKNGCVLRTSTYDRLMSTGLCCGVLR